MRRVGGHRRRLTSVRSEEKISLEVGQLQLILSSGDFSAHRLELVWPMRRGETEAEGVETTFDQFLGILGEVDRRHADVTDHPEQMDSLPGRRDEGWKEGR